MTNEPKAVAKSLHTITVIQQVAKLHQIRFNESRESAVISAMEILGLNDRPDPYGLREKAMRLMKP